MSYMWDIEFQNLHLFILFVPTPADQKPCILWEDRTTSLLLSHHAKHTVTSGKNQFALQLKVQLESVGDDIYTYSVKHSWFH